MFTPEVIYDAAQQALCSAVVFILLWVILGRFVFKPYLSLLDQRDDRTLGDEKRAREKATQAETVVQRIEEELKTATLKGLQIRDEHVNTAKSKARDIMAQSLDLSKAELGAARDEISMARAEARKELGGQIGEISESILAKVLSSSQHGAVH